MGIKIGRGGIRTHGPFQVFCFQVRCFPNILNKCHERTTSPGGDQRIDISRALLCIIGCQCAKFVLKAQGLYAVLMLLLNCLPKWSAASAKNAERLRFSRLAR